jgi:hypothetical protein
MIMNLIGFVVTTYVINESFLLIAVCMSLDGQMIIRQAPTITMVYWLSVLR